MKQYGVHATGGYHALMCNQSQASIDRNMTRQAWYAAKLITLREGFCSLNQLALPAEEELKNVSAASKQALVWCSMCRKFLCFHCIYDSESLQASHPNLM
jgi:hypothetical protein